MNLKQNCIYVPNLIFQHRQNLQQNLADCFEVYQNKLKKQSQPLNILSNISNTLHAYQEQKKISTQKQQEICIQKCQKKKKYSPRKMRKRAIFQFDFEEDSIKDQKQCVNQQEVQEVQKQSEKRTIPQQEKTEQQFVNFDEPEIKVKRFNFLHNQLNFSSSSDQQNVQRVQSQSPQKQLKIFFPKLRPKMLSGFSDDEQNKQQEIQNSDKEPNKLTKNQLKEQVQTSNSSQQQTNKTIKSSTYINTTDLRRQFVLQGQQYLKIPLPPNKSIQLILKRDKSKTKSKYIEYHIFDSKNFKQILTIKKSEHYEIFAKTNIQNPKAGPNQIYHTATLSNNFFGNTFNLYYPPKTSGLKNQQTAATITYETNILGLNGPRKMNIYLAKDPLILGDLNLQDFYVGNTQSSKKQVEKYVNKEAKWNPNAKSYVLNLKGRAKLSSVKNFVIVKEDKNQKTQIKETNKFQRSYAIFGKIGKDTFNLVVSSPFSILQGVAVGLSTFQRKITCQ